MGNFTHPSVFDAHVGETTVEFLRGEMTVESNNLSVMSMRLRCRGLRETARDSEMW